MVGLQASGKSFKARQIAKASPGTVIVSSDEIRKLHRLANEKETDYGEDMNDMVFGCARILVEAYLMAGINVVVDATNVTRRARGDWIEIGKWCGASIYCMEMLFDLKKAIWRSKLRPHVVPEDVIREKAAKYEKPVLDEGFDGVGYY